MIEETQREGIGIEETIEVEIQDTGGVGRGVTKEAPEDRIMSPANKDLYLDLRVNKTNNEGEFPNNEDNLT